MNAEPAEHADKHFVCELCELRVRRGQDERWKFERRWDGFATSARSCAARASCAWSAATRNTNSGRD